VFSEDSLPLPGVLDAHARLARLHGPQALSGGRVDVSIGSALDIFGGSLPYADVVAWSARQ
jgi:phosphoribosylformimino-5-aminoimidazole carboxamide ribotide isomerase